MTIFEAIHEKSIEKVIGALDAGADINESHGYEKATPLMAACGAGDPEIISYLLEKGADNSLRDKDGHTALFYVYNVENLKILLDNKFSPDEKNSSGTSILMEIIDSGDFDNRLEAVKLMIARGVKINDKNDNGWTALTFAAKHDLLEIAELLIASGADVNVKGTYYGDEGAFSGNVALLCSIYNGSKAMQKLLKDNGAI
jgi:ankyrin repeat protein